MASMIERHWMVRRVTPRRFALVLAASLMMIAGTAGLTPVSAASAAECVSLTGAQPPDLSTSAPGSVQVFGVATTSACDAWMVGVLAAGGNAGNGSTLVEHWNGSTWSVVPSPSPSSSNLVSVSALSATSAWAVGNEENLDVAGGERDAVIEHWDGTSWTQQGVSGSRAGTGLGSVTAISPTNVWAVGTTDAVNPDGSFSEQPLIEHFGGGSWSVVPNPSPDSSPGARNFLAGVAASSATDVWAVGDTRSGGFFEHWDGSAWSLVSPASPAIGTFLPTSVAVTSATNAWAGGFAISGQNRVPEVEHWDGSTWSVASVPAPGVAGDTSYFTSVAASSATDAWAVGVVSDSVTFNPGQAFIEHWDGSTWSQVPMPIIGSDSNANAVAVAPNRTGWVIGDAPDIRNGSNFALHLQCC